MYYADYSNKQVMFWYNLKITVPSERKYIFDCILMS